MPEFKSNKKAFDSQVKIYKGLRQILLRKPLSEVTVSDIKAECNISRSTFYRNYKNILDILDVTFDYYYHRYLNNRVNASNQLKYFFEYWVNHRDLVYIMTNQCGYVLKNIIIKYADIYASNIFFIDIKFALFTTVLSRWSERKKETPEEMYEIFSKILDNKCIDYLLK